MTLKTKAIIFVLPVFCALRADARPRVGFGGAAAGFGYARGFYPGFFPCYGLPWIYPGFYTGFGYQPNLGEVRLRTSSPKGSVYLDGGYAGEVSKLKHIWLEPGVYNLQVRTEGRAPFQERIYVLSGKTLQIRPEAASK